MKKVMSVSLGSSKRDHRAVLKIGDETVSVERIGTDGDKRAALEIISAMRGSVDAFGIGGTDLYIRAGQKRYMFRESEAFVKAAGDTPIVDGSGLKDTLERSVIFGLQRDNIVDFAGMPVLLVCGVDRFGMAEAIASLGGKLRFGDLMFGLGVPLALANFNSLRRLARVIAPLVTKLPIEWFYPIGKGQTLRTPKYAREFQRAHIVAGDFHFIRRFMPDNLGGKIVITNTVTADDRILLKKSGIRLLITTTPDFGGRSFGTNAVEAMLAALGARTAADYAALAKRYGLKPSINRFGGNTV